jgi:Cu(I)/Ag(I) efflux system membrane fusion protein/cobalt-zinc-cadmium efflux system membrane fusion protein
MTLFSPADGIITGKHVLEGEAVKAGKTLFNITSLDTVWAIAQIYENELPWISLRDKVSISSAFDPGTTVNGYIDFIYPIIDPVNRTVQARIILPNRNLRFLPEMYVDVSISSKVKKNRVSVQKSAVIRSGERDIVFVSLGEGRFEPREVHVGIDSDQYYEILHGLNAGEDVVISAQFLLDSESRLQEAIQRRLELKRKTGNSSIDAEMPQGHQH